MLRLRTSSWIDASTVTTVDNAFWFSDITCQRKTTPSLEIWSSPKTLDTPLGQEYECAMKTPRYIQKTQEARGAWRRKTFDRRHYLADVADVVLGLLVVLGGRLDVLEPDVKQLEGALDGVQLRDGQQLHLRRSSPASSSSSTLKRRAT